MNAITPQLSATMRTFSQLLSSSRRGARLARLLAVEQLRAWEVSPGVTERAEQIVAELANNAALHGRVQGRDFRLTLTLDTGILHIAVTDARGNQLPSLSASADRGPLPDGESGRGLLLVAALADRWGTDPYPPGGKTVWTEITLAPIEAGAVASGPGRVGRSRFADSTTACGSAAHETAVFLETVTNGKDEPTSWESVMAGNGR
ncbi:ATP-binding protein [Streptomyces rubiginosohelvolus]|uniref:ATP-binding protein n=1 Tax=Streptomyces rubiginosohelvolus TaxID=67362 RepID=UPI0036964F1A